VVGKGKEEDSKVEDGNGKGEDLYGGPETASQPAKWLTFWPLGHQAQSMAHTHKSTRFQVWDRALPGAP